MCNILPEKTDTVKGTARTNQEEDILLNYLKNTPMKLNILEDVVPQCQKTASWQAFFLWISHDPIV